MKVLIKCTENPNFLIEVLDELELFIYKKVIIDEKKIPSVRRAFLPFNLDTAPFQVKVF
jgi:hypothetical protein